MAIEYAFCKYHGAGNDFVVVRGEGLPGALRAADGSVRPEVVRGACHRRFGVGADGFIVLERCGEREVTMGFYNSDGYPSTMCGNGARCTFSAAVYLYGLEHRELALHTGAGVARAALVERMGEREELVRIALPPVGAAVEDAASGGLVLNTGVPHLVKRVEEVRGYDMSEVAPRWRREVNARNGGVNVNICSGGDGCYSARTFERGVEGETLACGTGAVAVALAMNQAEGACSPVGVRMPGGELEVHFRRMEHGGWEGVELVGPTVRICEGMAWHAEA
ncbi:MAG: diaminopimelate epimerase [Bacteroidia bacterium]|nr:MAG: diaminopimelate epimerase [Bacteroidia bacterium]